MKVRKLSKLSKTIVFLQETDVDAFIVPPPEFLDTPKDNVTSLEIRHGRSKISAEPKMRPLTVFGADSIPQRTTSRSLPVAPKNSEIELPSIAERKEQLKLAFSNTKANGIGNKHEAKIENGVSHGPPLPPRGSRVDHTSKVMS